MLEGKAIEPDLYFCIDKIRWSAYQLMGDTGPRAAASLASLPLVVAMMGTGRLLSNIHLSSLVFDSYVVSTLRAHDSYWDDAAGPIHCAARPEGKVKRLACFLLLSHRYKRLVSTATIRTHVREHKATPPIYGYVRDVPGCAMIAMQELLALLDPLFCHPTDRTSNVTKGPQCLRLSIELHSLEATTLP